MSNNVLRERAEWALSMISEGIDAPSQSELAEHISPAAGPNGGGIAESLGFWSMNLGRDFTLEGIEEETDDIGSEVRYRITGANGRRWIGRFFGDGESRPRLVRIRLDRRLPDGVVVRDAVPADGDAISALYRSTPIEAGDLRVTIDPGPDYFATTRLMDESRTLVATEHGKIIGVYCGTLYGGRFRGADVTITLGCHSRMASGKSGGGVWSNMNRTLLDGFEGRWDVPLAFVLAGNTAASRLTMAGAWPAHPERAVIRCRGGEADACGRPASPSDARDIVDVINATHEGQDLFRPYSVESLTARLERAPDLYSWDDLLVADGAVVGVGKVHQGRVTEGPSGVETTTRALVFDYGVVPGAESTFSALLGAAGAVVAARSATHLSVFTTAAARTYPLLRDLADAMEVYDVLIPGHDPDDDAATRGIYVDQVHF